MRDTVARKPVRASRDDDIQRGNSKGAGLENNRSTGLLGALGILEL